MTLHIVQKGQGETRPLVLGFLMSMSIDSKLRSAFGPAPCIITSSSDETPDLAGIAEWAYKYAGLQAISRLALMGFSAGCQRVRSMYRDEGVRANAYLLVDGTHASLPPEPSQIDWLRGLCSSAKTGSPLVVASHTLQTYVERLPPKERFASTLRVLRMTTGFELPEAGPLDAPMVTREGQLWVYSFASAQADAAAHMAQHDRVLPALAAMHLGPWLARPSSGSSASSQAAAGVGGGTGSGLGLGLLAAGALFLAKG